MSEKSETLREKASGETLPRLELKSIIKRLAFASVPHLPRELQIDWIASKISREASKPVEPGTVKNWWYAQDDDDRVVDSRHMDWARSRDRAFAANDNRAARHTGDCLPPSPQLIAA